MSIPITPRMMGPTLYCEKKDHTFDLVSHVSRALERENENDIKVRAAKRPMALKVHQDGFKPADFLE